MANGLLALGLTPQDRIGVLEDNTLESADLFCGAAIANLVRVPLYPRNARESHLHMLGYTGCRAVVVAQQSDVDPDLPIDPEDRFIIRHTGGTTGKSKGVAYSHRACISRRSATAPAISSCPSGSAAAATR